MVGGNCGKKQDPSQCLKENTCLPSLKEDLCNRMKPAQVSSDVLENVLDIASTLVDILQMCGIHECKANRALDVIIYAFMHFDEVAEHPGGKCKKRIRKEDFRNDLTRDCGMTKADMKLTYSIVKCAFKAFYHKQVLKNYNTALVDECVWRSAANKTVGTFAKLGAPKSEIDLTGRRILSAYENFIFRLQARSFRKGGAGNPCICSSVPSWPCRHAEDPCEPEYLQPCHPPDPPLCAQLQCQFVCPPGEKYPHIICKDPCGRLFLKVDGDTICFDPLILECEARRAAMEICPPSNAERIKSLRECIKPCMPKDTDSCDEKLGEIGMEEDDDKLKDMGGMSEIEGDEEEDDTQGKDSKGKGDGDDGEDGEQEEDDDDDDDDGDGDGLGRGFFISADLRTLENGKRKLDVKIRGKCRKSEKLINVLNGLHIEGNDQEQIYVLTPTNGDETGQKDASKIPSEASHVNMKPPQNEDSAHSSQVLEEEKLDVVEPAEKDEDTVAQHEQDAGEPAEGHTDNNTSNIEEPAAAVENAGGE